MSCAKLPTCKHLQRSERCAMPQHLPPPMLPASETQLQSASVCVLRFKIRGPLDGVLRVRR